MLQTKVIEELNRRYLTVLRDGALQVEDYRFRMLLSNCIDNIIPMQLRTINGQKEIYYDITDKESLSEYFQLDHADRDTVRNLFATMKKVSSDVSRFLIEEDNIDFRPDMVFRDIKTGEFEFVCLPIAKDPDDRSRSGLRDLLLFLTEHTAADDDLLVNCVYSLYDLAAFRGVSITTLYEALNDELKELVAEETEEENEYLLSDDTDEEEPEPHVRRRRYIPSFKELGAVSLTLIGLIMVGLNIYVSIAY